MKDSNVLAAKVQQAWLDACTEEAAIDGLTGVEGIATTAVSEGKQPVERGSDGGTSRSHRVDAGGPD